MKIILCLNRDIHAALALNLIFPALKNHQVKIILSEAPAKTTNLPDEILQLKKHEQDAMNDLFAKLDGLIQHKYCLGTLRKLFSRKQYNHNSKFKTFNQIAHFFNNKITTYHDINASDAVADIKNFNPDLIISIRFKQIFHEQIIKIPQRGIVNLHSGILPKYRGIMPSFWAILRGEKEVGCTLHYIDDSRIDYGRVISFSRQNVLPERSLIFNVGSLYKEGCKMIVSFLQQVEKGSDISTLDQAELGKVNYFSTPQQDSVEKFCEIMPMATKNDVSEIYQNWI